MKFTKAFMLIGFLAGLLTFDTPLFGQSSEKTISVPSSVIKEMVTISEPRVGDRLLSFDQSFSEGSDWIGRTHFKLENVSSKSIVYLRVNIWFPETTATGNVMVFSLVFGRRPGSKVPSKEPLLTLTPKQTLDVDLASKYADISRFLNDR